MKERHRRGTEFFLLDSLKKVFWNEKSNAQINAIRAFFQNHFNALFCFFLLNGWKYSSIRLPGITTQQRLDPNNNTSWLWGFSPIEMPMTCTNSTKSWANWWCSFESMIPKVKWITSEFGSNCIEKEHFF